MPDRLPLLSFGFSSLLSPGWFLLLELDLESLDCAIELPHELPSYFEPLNSFGMLVLLLLTREGGHSLFTVRNIFAPMSLTERM